MTDQPVRDLDDGSFWANRSDSRQFCATEALRRAARGVGSLVASAQPLDVFTSLAEALVQCGALSVTVEMIDHETVTRVVRDGAGSVPATTATHALLPQTQRLFAGGGEPLIEGSVMAVAIRSTDHLPFVEPAPGRDFIGAVVGRYPDPGPGSLDEELTRTLVRHAVSLIHQQRHEQALRTRVANLETALDTNREIATAIGIVMASRELSADDAFEWLRQLSQLKNRKLRDIATDVVSAGWSVG